MRDLAKWKLTSSSQIFRCCDRGRDLLIHRLTGSTVQATADVLDLLELFNNPMSPASLDGHPAGPNRRTTITHLVELGFLIPANTDEEAEWLKGMLPPDGWRMLQTAHFFIHHVSSEGNTARDFAGLLEKAHALLMKRGIFHPGRKIVAVLCRSRRQFRQFWGPIPLPEWLRAFIHVGRILILDQNKTSYSERRSPGLLSAIVHELVHVFIHQDNMRLPIWTEEGICDYLSRRFDEGRFRTLAAENGVYGLREMEALALNSLFDLDDSPDWGNLCYQQAHSYVKFLVGLAGERRFITCVRSTGLNRSFRQAFREQYERDLDGIEGEWMERYQVSQVKRLRPSAGMRIVENREVCCSTAR